MLIIDGMIIVFTPFISLILLILMVFWVDSLKYLLLTFPALIHINRTPQTHRLLFSLLLRCHFRFINKHLDIVVLVLLSLCSWRLKCLHSISFDKVLFRPWRFLSMNIIDYLLVELFELVKWNLFLTFPQIHHLFLKLIDFAVPQLYGLMKILNLLILTQVLILEFICLGWFSNLLIIVHKIFQLVTRNIVDFL